MSNISQTMAEMIARARPQQAPPPGRVQVAGGGPLQSQSTQVSASIDLGAIQRLFNLGTEKEDQMIGEMFKVYNSQEGLDEETMTKRERDIDEPFMQTILKKAFREGKNPYLRKDAIVDEQTGDVKERYTFKKVPAGETLGNVEPTRVMSGMYGPGARNQFLGGQMMRERAAASGGENKELMAANKSWADFQKQYSRIKDPLMAEPQRLYEENQAMMAKANNHLSNVFAATRSYEDAMGAVDFAISNVQQEFLTPANPNDNSQDVRRQSYIREFTNMVRKTQTQDPRYYVELMEWTLRHWRNTDRVFEHFSTEFNFDEKAINLLYARTPTAELARKQAEMEEKERGKQSFTDFIKGMFQSKPQETLLPASGSVDPSPKHNPNIQRRR